MHKIFLALLCLTLTSCFQFPKRSGQADVDELSSSLNSSDSSIIETLPMMKPAANEMYQKALEFEKQNNDKQAIQHLQIAHEIQPQAPQVTQKLAEIYLRRGDFDKSFSWSRLAAMNGPSKGKLCEKSWNILAISAEQLSEIPTLEHAQEQASLCIEKPMDRF